MGACEDEMNRKLLRAQCGRFHSPALNFDKDSVVQLSDGEIWQSR
jgi:hypothetical protein